MFTYFRGKCKAYIFTMMCRNSLSKYVIKHFKIQDLFIYSLHHTFTFIYPKRLKLHFLGPFSDFLLKYIIRQVFNAPNSSEGTKQ